MPPVVAVGPKVSESGGKRNKKEKTFKINMIIFGFFLN